MGASHTTLASTSTGGEDGILPELDGAGQGNNPSYNASSSTTAAKHDLSDYFLDQPLFPGSGRMMRTFRIRHKQNDSMAILKTMYVSKLHEHAVQEQEQELKRILKALQGQPHVAPFLYWSMGPYRQRSTGSNVSNTVRQISLLRPHIYTTLAERLASRPFLTHVEKLWISYQLLDALQAMHSKGVVHGFITAENVGLTSWNWVVILDVSSYKARTSLPDDDPTEYLYYFQENFSNPYAQGSDTTRREKRCYLAPERFYTPNIEQPSSSEQAMLLPAMDIFSTGCVLIETFLNGERVIDLGDLMEYRKKGASSTIQQKLNKIEYSALRAACRHMLHLNPSDRLSAQDYIERLQASELFPQSFTVLAKMMEKITYLPPDARISVAAAFYSKIMWESMGKIDMEGSSYVRNALGPTMVQQMESDSGYDGAEVKEEKDVKEKKDESIVGNDLFAETEALLKKLEALQVGNDDINSDTSNEKIDGRIQSDADQHLAEENRSEISRSSMLIFLQLILSTTPHSQRPSSKLVALQILIRLGQSMDDEARLQRIVPVMVALLQDHDPLVRASAIQVLAKSLSIIESFPPSDSKLFPEYIFKRVAHLITDPALVVRLAFARSLASLAETSQRFLDIAHAVQLYEATGGGSAPSKDSESTEISSVSDNVFTDDVTKLLDGPSLNATEAKKKLESRSSSGFDSVDSERASASGKNLIKSTYKEDLSGLHETVSRWVVHITTDQSEHSSPTKQALLTDIGKLCSFFGLDGVMAFILPQILSFLNDRMDWQLRSSLFNCLPSVCQIIGRAATEHFVLPCLETALVDRSESVVASALYCLSQLISMGLLNRAIILGTPSADTGEESQGLLRKYATLLIHPSTSVRHFMILTVNALGESLGCIDAEIFIPIVIRSFLRFKPSFSHLITEKGMEKCLYSQWTQTKFNQELEKARNTSPQSYSKGPWTSVAVLESEGIQHSKKTGIERDTASLDRLTQEVRSFLQMLAKRWMYTHASEKGLKSMNQQLNDCIEGSLKLSQQIKFPKQAVSGLPTACIPSWYEQSREKLRNERDVATEYVAIRSVSALGQVYGLSIMDQSDITSGSSPEYNPSPKLADSLQDQGYEQIDAFCTGEWGSETNLDPTLSDTSLLVTKLNALHVPPLPPKLIGDKLSTSLSSPHLRTGKQQHQNSNSEWKLKIDTMVASSKCDAKHGHTAPIVRLVVSQDQRFFVTGSHDATCRIWELDNVEQSNGLLESRSVYSGHHNVQGSNPRINDVAMVEGGHSVISGASDGSIHSWRVDLVSQKQASTYSTGKSTSRVVGSSEIRKANSGEGSILTVNHFNTASASIYTYTTQNGLVHSWDLRAALEPFQLSLPQDTGYVTSMALGNDRNWVVAGTSKGFIALWDLRFQQMLKLWHHSRSTVINRVATSFVPPPQSWISKGNASSAAKPFVFAACGPNECAMFDLSTGSCRECFRTVDYTDRSSRSRLNDMPSLQEMPLSSPFRRSLLLSGGLRSKMQDSVTSSFRSVNAMVGSIGASDQSFLLTGGSDCRIRFWDFAIPSKCYTSAGPETVQPRPTFERIDYDQTSRLMLCRQPPAPSLRELDGSKIARKLLQSTKRSESFHDDAITDLKVIKTGLLSCSRDCTVKLWR